MLHPAILAPAALTAVSLTLFLPNTSALAVDSSQDALFSGSGSGSFGVPTIDESIDPDAMFSIERGSPETETFVLGEPGPDSMPNRLSFSGNSFEAAIDQTFAVGSLSYLNGQTYGGTHVSSVPLAINLKLDQPVNNRPSISYHFGFDLTPNDNSPTSADRLMISENPETQTFTVSARDYQLDVLGFSQDNGTTFANSLQVSEDSIVESTLFAQIQLAAASLDENIPAEIPEPASISGLLLLGGCFLIRKKR